MRKLALLGVFLLAGCVGTGFHQDDVPSGSVTPLLTCKRDRCPVPVSVKDEGALGCVITVPDTVEVFGRFFIVWAIDSSSPGYRFTSDGVDLKRIQTHVNNPSLDFSNEGRDFFDSRRYLWWSAHGRYDLPFLYAIKVERLRDGRRCTLDPVIINRGRV